MTVRSPPFKLLHFGTKCRVLVAAGGIVNGVNAWFGQSCRSAIGRSTKNVCVEAARPGTLRPIMKPDGPLGRRAVTPLCVPWIGWVCARARVGASARRPRATRANPPLDYVRVHSMSSQVKYIYAYILYRPEHIYMVGLGVLRMGSSMAVPATRNPPAHSSVRARHACHSDHKQDAFC